MTPADSPTFIIIVNWNGRADTLECLASLHNAALPNVRTVVVDNGSEDGSAAAIRDAYPAVTLIEAGKNLRFAGGNNLGIRHALEQGAGQILLLNNDTTVAPDFLGHLSRTLTETPGAGVVAPKILYYSSPREIWYAGGEVSFWTGTMRHVGIRATDGPGFGSVTDTAYASGCCFLASRSAFEKVGLLDETYFIYTEDADWCMRARTAGYRILFEPRARIWHKVSVSAGGHLSAYKLRHKYMSNMRFFARHATWYHWLVFPWLNVVVNGVAALRYLSARR
jgi:GT2 family glycosyltransferase